MTGVPHPLRFSANRLSQALLAACALVWVWSATAPFDRSDWLLENILLVIGAGFVVWIERRAPLSDVAHVLLAVFFIMHMVGAHYTYSEVPLGHWLKDVFGTERNFYDRIVHFGWGLLLTIPVREVLMRATGLRAFAANFCTFAVMVASSEIYELMEWGTALVVSPETAMAFLGTQGDPFDAQKDTALALAGTVIALAASTWAGHKTGGSQE
jgi:putative membrane protein